MNTQRDRYIVDMSSCILSSVLYIMLHSEYSGAAAATANKRCSKRARWARSSCWSTAG